MSFTRIVYLLLALLGAFSVNAMEIKGQIQLQDEWQPVVYLASLNSPENLFVASPEFIIAETFIQPDGTFSISTNSIPDDARFYRLYLVKSNNSSVEFNTSVHRNFQHLLLDRRSNISIKAAIENNTLVIKTLSGSHENSEILQFDKELEKRELQFHNDLSKAQHNFLSKDLENYIKDFANSASNSLVALYALYHLEEKDTDFLRNSEFYFNFQKRIEQEYPNSFYADAYGELLNELIGFREMVCEMPGVQAKWKDNVLVIQAILIALLVLVVVLLLLKIKRLHTRGTQSSNRQTAFTLLTQKQQQILELLAKGKTNKEIAAELFVELSTVKTHINSIYKQLQVSNRKEAVSYYNSLEK